MAEVAEIDALPIVTRVAKSTAWNTLHNVTGEIEVVSYVLDAGLNPALCQPNIYENERIGL
jgi:hypothetical protein